MSMSTHKWEQLLPQYPIGMVIQRIWKPKVIVKQNFTHNTHGILLQKV